MGCANWSDIFVQIVRKRTAGGTVVMKHVIGGMLEKIQQQKRAGE